MEWRNGLSWMEILSIGVFIAHASGVGARSIYTEQEEEDASDGDDFVHKTTIVLSCTFSLGLVFGALWCYCMSAVCGTRQPAHKHPRLSAPTRRHDYVRDRYPPRSRTQYSSESPTPSDVSTRSSSPLP